MTSAARLQTRNVALRDK